MREDSYNKLIPSRKRGNEPVDLMFHFPADSINSIIKQDSGGTNLERKIEMHHDINVAVVSLTTYDPQYSLSIRLIGFKVIKSHNRRSFHLHTTASNRIFPGGPMVLNRLTPWHGMVHTTRGRHKLRYDECFI